VSANERLAAEICTVIHHGQASRPTNKLNRKPSESAHYRGAVRTKLRLAQLPRVPFESSSSLPFQVCDITTINIDIAVAIDHSTSQHSDYRRRPTLRFY
jgi:hypothetical protein